MRTKLLQLGLLGSLAVSAQACSWSRFDDVTANAPIVLLNEAGLRQQPRLDE